MSSLPPTASVFVQNLYGTSAALVKLDDNIKATVLVSFEDQDYGFLGHRAVDWPELHDLLTMGSVQLTTPDAYDAVIAPPNEDKAKAFSQLLTTVGKEFQAMAAAQGKDMETQNFSTSTDVNTLPSASCQSCTSENINQMLSHFPDRARILIQTLFGTSAELVRLEDSVKVTVLVSFKDQDYGFLGHRAVDWPELRDLLTECGVQTITPDDCDTIRPNNVSVVAGRITVPCGGDQEKKMFQLQERVAKEYKAMIDAQHSSLLTHGANSSPAAPASGEETVSIQPTRKAPTSNNTSTPDLRSFETVFHYSYSCPTALGPMMPTSQALPTTPTAWPTIDWTVPLSFHSSAFRQRRNLNQQSPHY